MTNNPYYSGPVSDHFDGTRFFIPGGAPDKTRGDLWRLMRTPRATWPDHVANPPAAPVAARVDGSALRVTTIGHATVLIQTRGLNILVDPVWSKRASPFSFAGPKRVAAPGLALADLPKLDAIVITHNHYDHLDLATLDALQIQNWCRILAPLGNDAIIKRRHPNLAVEAYDWGDRVALATDVTLTLVPTHHWSARWLNDRRMALWAGFVLESPDGPIYHIGDTAYRDGAIFHDIPRRFGRPRLAIIPIGAYEPRWFMKDAHVEPFESVQIFQDCEAHHALAHHWGTFQLTTEAIDDPPFRLAKALNEAGIASERFRVQRPGTAFDVPAVPH
jgi:L-ascorbate metabolism protein UlaG (beta-lactamase superfamily)